MTLELAYHPNLYLGESIHMKKLDKIKKKLENKPLFCRVYLVVISRNPSGLLEIYQARQLAQEYYQKYPPYIVGIAGGWTEAVLLVKGIVEECLKTRGDCALKEYLQC